jgi:hypothetical protein
MPRATEKPDKQEDSFGDLIQSVLEKQLQMPLDPKEMNPTLANAIRFWLGRNKLSAGDDDSYWGKG